MPIVNPKADQVSKAFVRERSLKLRSNPADRLVESSVPDAQFVRVRRHGFVDSRKKAVRAIVWRAVALERELWEVPPKTLKNLDTIALKEMLDRRLRVIERMAGNISSRGKILEDNAKAKLICSDPDTGWRDGLRVRLFEYPSFGLEPLNQLGDRLSVIKQPGQTGKWKLNVDTLGYHVAPQPVTRTYDNNPGDFEILPAKIDWYFPANVKQSWVVSPGRQNQHSGGSRRARGLTGTDVIGRSTSWILGLELTAHPSVVGATCACVGLRRIRR